MEKFTTTQLQDALLVLHARNDIDSVAAYRIAFDELARRMGEEEFCAWCDENSI